MYKGVGRAMKENFIEVGGEVLGLGSVAVGALTVYAKPFDDLISITAGLAMTASGIAIYKFSRYMGRKYSQSDDKVNPDFYMSAV